MERERDGEKARAMMKRKVISKGGREKEKREEGERLIY